ncbi:MAG: YegS/Rv2252/BmrU family lipid kinase [Erysipelotrichaceae bacterium]|nr:YegS/Rv2252/BmrU family lipid kinase [Erysipelotrichaceae bacterium]
MKNIFIVNPKAGAEDNLQLVKRKIAEAGLQDQCDIYVTLSKGNATIFAEEYIKEHPGEEIRFIACGGDGTICEVFNAAIHKENVSVSVFPCGSGNDFVKVFGGPERFMDIRKIIEAPSRKIDVLKVGDRYSINVVNFGFDTTVAIQVNKDRDRTGKGSKSSYTKGIIKALITSMKNDFKVYADGELLDTSGVALLCTLGNGQYVGGSFRCSPRAVLDDGLIEVCLVKTISRLKFVQLIKSYTEGTHLDDPKLQNIIIYRQAKKVDVEAPEGFAFSLDGEIVYQNKFSVEIDEKALNLAVPE